MKSTLTIVSVVLYWLLLSTASSQESDIERRVVIISPQDCLLLDEHIPDDDVNYKPDVDVRGKNLVPAEVESGNSLGLGENGFSFYMTHDALKDNEIAEAYGLTDAQEGKMILGRISILDGDVYWNGSSMKSAERNQIYALCREQGYGKNRPILKR